MGGFLGGLAAGIGGAAAPIEHRNEQIRGLLESRRNHFADLLYQSAAQEVDPIRKADYLRMSSDLLKGVDMGKIVPAFVKMAQTHHENNESLNQVFPQPQQPKPQPGNAPGVTPGQPIAAQPATSPVQPQAQGGVPDITQGLQAAAPTQATPPAIPSIEAAAQAQPVQPVAAPAAGAGFELPPGYPKPRGAQAIFQSYQSHPWMQTTAGRAALQPIINAEIQHDQALQQKLEETQGSLALRRQAVEHMKKSGMWDKLQPWQQAAYEAETGGLTPVSMPGFAMTPRVLSLDTPGASAPEGQIDAFGQPVARTPDARYRLEQTMGGQPMWYPRMAESPLVTTDAGGGQNLNSRRTGSKVAGLEGAVAPSTASPNIRGVDAQGNFDVTSAARLNAGLPKINTGLTPIAELPHTSTQVTEVPGQPTETRTSTRTVGGVRGVGAGTAPRSSSGGTPAVDNVAKSNYEAWAAGGPAPTGKSLAGALQYAQSQGLTAPVPMSATGQKDVATINDVLGQIKRIKQQMQSAGLDKDTSYDKYSDFLRAQRLGQATPLGGLWTDLSFEGLRSGSAAMKGMSTRGQMIFERAMEHVPRPSGEFNPRGHEQLHAPDTPARMYQKLNEMEGILTHSLDEVMKDETKSGVIRPVAAGGVKSINSQAEYDALPSGAEYIDAQTGHRAKKP